jgi:copper(I)-binding protein
MTRAILAFLLLAPIAAHAADLTVSDAFTRATPGTGPGAAYLTIHGGDAADRLLSAASPRAASVELHTMTMDGAVMRMRQIDALDVPAGAAVTLAPGGLHLMLQGLKAPLKQGETVSLILTFEKAGQRRIDAPVGPIGATMAPMPGMDGHKH